MEFNRSIITFRVDSLSCNVDLFLEISLTGSALAPSSIVNCAEICLTPDPFTAIDAQFSVCHSIAVKAS